MWNIKLSQYILIYNNNCYQCIPIIGTYSKYCDVIADGCIVFVYSGATKLPTRSAVSKNLQYHIFLCFVLRCNIVVLSDTSNPILCRFFETQTSSETLNASRVRKNHTVCVLNQNKNTTTVVKYRSTRRILFNSIILIFYTSYNIVIIIIDITITIIIYDDDRTSFEILLSLCRQCTAISRSVQYYTDGSSIIIIAEQCGEAFTAPRYTYITHNILYNNIITAVV